MICPSFSSAALGGCVLCWGGLQTAGCVRREKALGHPPQALTGLRVLEHAVAQVYGRQRGVFDEFLEAPGRGRVCAGVAQDQ